MQADQARFNDCCVGNVLPCVQASSLLPQQPGCKYAWYCSGQPKPRTLVKGFLSGSRRASPQVAKWLVILPVPTLSVEIFSEVAFCMLEIPAGSFPHVLN